MKDICIIPARLGSKRIKEKNIKKFLGRPIISRVIEMALKSKCFKEVFVSTESKKIKIISEKAGANVPFLRDKFLSKDNIGTGEVAKHFILKLIKYDFKFKNVCVIYPTAVCTKINHIRKAKKYINNQRIDYVFFAKEFDHPIERAFIINNGFTKAINKKKLFEQTQNFKKKYFDAGQFYYARKEVFFSNKIPMNSNSKVIIDKENYISDIDNLYQWKLLEKIFK